MFKTTIRGGQHLVHNLNMLSQIFKFSLMFSISTFFAYCAYLVYQDNFLTLNGSRACIYEFKEFKNNNIDTFEICPAVAKVWINILLDAIKVIVPTILFSLLCYLVYGYFISRQRDDHLSNNITNPFMARINLKLKKKDSIFHIGNVPLIKDTENKHIFILGDTGTGKTTAINSLLTQIRMQKEKAIILDIADVFTNNYMEYGDTIIHPGSNNSVFFDPFENSYHDKWLTSAIAKSICASNKHQDPFWSESAQSILTALITKFHTAKDIEKVMKLSLKDLYKALEDTPAHLFVNPNIDKTALSSVATLMSKLNFISILDDDPKIKFSLTDWEQKDKSWLFLRSTIAERASLIPYFRAILAFFFNTRSLNDKNQRIWLIIDELAALENFDILPQMISELRKYNVCIVAATQNKSQIDEHYGKSANTILSNFGTNLIFRCSEPSSAKWLEQKIGGKYVLDKSESISYGANTHRDGVTLSDRKSFVPFVSANQIQQLETLQAILLLPENIVKPVKVNLN